MIIYEVISKSLEENFGDVVGIILAEDLVKAKRWASKIWSLRKVGLERIGTTDSNNEKGIILHK